MRRNIIYLSLVLATVISGCRSYTSGNLVVTPAPLHVRGDSVEFTAKVELPGDQKYRKGTTLEIAPELGGQKFPPRYIQLDEYQPKEPVNASLVFTAPYNEQEMAGKKLDVETEFVFRNGKRKDGKDYDGLAACCTQLPGLYIMNAPVSSIPAEGKAPEAVKLVSQFNFPKDVYRLSPDQITDQDVQALLDFLKTEGASGKIIIHGYASPEGSTAHNEALARNRALVVKDLLVTKLKRSGAGNDVANKIQVKVKATAEDWDGFNAVIEASDLQNKSKIIELAKATEEDHKKERLVAMAIGGNDKAEKHLSALRRTAVVVPCKVECLKPEEVDSVSVAYSTGELRRDAIREIYQEERSLQTPLELGKTGKKSFLVSYYDAYPNDYRAYNEAGVLSVIAGNVQKLKADEDELKVKGDDYSLKAENKEFKYEDDYGRKARAEGEEYVLEDGSSKLKVNDEEVKLEENGAKAKISSDEVKVKGDNYELKTKEDEVKIKEKDLTVKVETDNRKYETADVKIKNEDDLKIKSEDLKIKVKDGQMKVKENGTVTRFDQIANNPQAQAYLSRYLEAEQHFLRAKALKENDNVVLNNLGAVYLNKNELTEAKVTIEHSLSIKETPEAFYSLGLVNALQGNYEAALANFNKAGDNPQYLYNRGLTRIIVGDIEGAQKDLQRFIIEYPNEAIAHYTMAVLGARTGNAEEVQKHLATACQLDNSLTSLASSDFEFREYPVDEYLAEE